MNLTTETRYISDAAGGQLRLLVMRPQRQTGLLPGILWLHGGGYSKGWAELARFSAGRQAAETCGAVLLAPDYRLSGSAPYPAALLDCYAALLYLQRNAEALGVREDQLMVGGESAGGGLTAALCMLAHDRGKVRIAFQMPLYPMLDCRDTATSAHNHTDPTWGTWRNHAAWKQYLGSLYGTQEVPAYASPSRREDYRGLPPCYTFVCRHEPFYEETVTYVAKLREAGVAAKADVFPGNFHAFDMLRVTPRAKAARAAFLEQFRYACANYTAPQPFWH